MPDPLTGLTLDDTQAQELIDFLGRQASGGFTGQPALPVGGLPVGGTAPATTATGMAPLGGASTQAGSKAQVSDGSKVIRSLQRGFGVADLARRLATSGAGGETVSSSDILGDAPSGRPEFQGARPPAAAPAPIGPPLDGVPIDAFGAGIEPGGLPVTPAAPTFDYGAFLSNYAHSYLPYLSAAFAAPGIAQRAESDLPAGEQALMALVDTIGAAASPATFGLSSGVGSLLDSVIAQIFGDPPLSHRIREAQGESGVASRFNQLLAPVRRARSPEELWQAFEPTTTENFRTARRSGYPIFASGDDLTHERLLGAIQSGDPTTLSFAWQAGVDPGFLTTANEGLNQAVRQQVALMQAAQAGEPAATGILEARNRAFQEETAAAESAHLAFLHQPYWGFTGDAP